MCKRGEPEVERVAGEILRYLEAHRSASDTVEGIAQWWIKRQRLEDALTLVQQALDRLVGESRVAPRLTGEGRVLYQLRREGD